MQGEKWTLSGTWAARSIWSTITIFGVGKFKLGISGCQHLPLQKKLSPTGCGRNENIIQRAQTETAPQTETLKEKEISRCRIVNSAPDNQGNGLTDSKGGSRLSLATNHTCVVPPRQRVLKTK